MYKSSWTIIISFFLFQTVSFSQSGPEHQTYDLISDGLDSSVAIPDLPSLDAIIDSARLHSPLILTNQTAVEIKQTELTTKKREILKSLSLYSNYFYGNNGMLVVNENFSGATTSGANTNIRTNFYQVGVQFKLDLGTLLDRKNQIKKQQLEVVYAKRQNSNLELQLKEQIIRQYRNLELTRKLLSIYAATKQNAFVNLQMAEKQFLDGEINISDVTRVTDTLTKATTEFERAKAEYLIAFEMLELTVGIDLK